jgi:hypothetical protein
MTVLDEEAVEERVRKLEPGALNGIRLVFVSLEPAPRPSFAWLDVEFHNANHLSPPPPPAKFEVSGGTRLIGGSKPGQVRVIDVAAGVAPKTLRLKVEPVGDYSTYMLKLVLDNTNRQFDPFFGAIEFKFRPGCFNLNCAPDRTVSPPAAEPAIDYLARDYDSFRHVLMTAMAQRVPGWQPTSEADLDQILIDLIAADADEIADRQDRVVHGLPYSRRQSGEHVARARGQRHRCFVRLHRMDA